MASFDKSYYDILTKYQSIREKFTITDDKGNVIGTYDELPAGLQTQQKSNSLPTPEENAAYFKKQADAIRATDPARAAAFDKQAGLVPQNAAVAATGGAITPSADPKAQVASVLDKAKTPQTSETPSQEELDLFKKLHGSTYNPNSSMDKAKFAQLQKAGKDVGGYGDTEKVRNAAYAQQYADKPELASAYAKKAGVQPNTAAAPVGVTPGSPIKPAGSQSTGNNFAQQAAQLGLSQSTQQSLSNNSTPGSPLSLTPPSSTPTSPASVTPTKSSATSTASTTPVKSVPTSRPKNRGKAQAA